MALDASSINQIWSQRLDQSEKNKLNSWPSYSVRLWKQTLLIVSREDIIHKRKTVNCNGPKLLTLYAYIE